MADFLTDYSGTAAAGSAFNSFAQAYQDAQDKQVKRQEAQAKMQAMQSQQERDATDQAIKLKLNNLKQGTGGGIEDAPPSVKQLNDQDIATTEKGLNVPKVDPVTGRIETPTWNPNSPQILGAKAKVTAATNSQGYKQDSLDLRKDVVDRREHQNVINKINSNPNIKTRLQQYQNLDNTLSNIANADHVTPEMFDEAQQAVRANLGIKGSSGVGERENTQMKALGLNADRLKEFLTMSPADVGKDNKLMAHIVNLAQMEKKNISGQFDKSLEASSSGHKSMYARRPDLKDDLRDAIGAQSAQLDSAPQQQAPASQGMVNQSPLQKATAPAGMVQGGQQQVPPPPAVDPSKMTREQKIKFLQGQ